jgi:hypothetical protein
LPNSTLTRVHPPEPRPGDDPRQIIYVRVGDVEVDQNVQRDVNPAKLEKMGEFDYTLAETPTVVERENGKLVAVEGQHRLILNQQEDQDRRMWMVLLGSEVDEPGIAYAITKSRSKHSAFQEWNLQLAKGDEVQVAADEVLKRLGLELSNYKRGIPGDNKIAAVAAVKRIVESEPTVEEGAALLDTTLSTMGFAFGEQDDQWASNLIKSVGFLIQRNPGVNTTRLSATLAKMTARRWLQEASHKREGQTAVECIATAIVAEYNRGLHQQSRVAW